MREPLRVIFVEHRTAGRGTAARLLTACHLEFSWQCAASQRELSQVAENFRPHIVLCTDDVTEKSAHGLLGALRLLCSQTPVILVTSVSDSDAAEGCQTAAPVVDIEQPLSTGARGRSTAPRESSRLAQDPADLRRGFCAVLESTTEPAVISDAEGWITHANTRACLRLESCERSLVSVLSATQDQCPKMPHWLPDSHDAGRALEIGIAATPGGTPEYCHHRLAYFDAWSLLPTLIHIDDLVGCLTVDEREYRPALTVIAVDRDSNRIPVDACDRALGQQSVGAASPDALTELVRYGSIVRISADDFLVVLAEPTRPADAAITTQQLLDSIAQTRALAGPAHRMGETWHASRNVHRMARARLGAELGDAMQYQGLGVHYQPQFDLKTGRGCGVEALARWVSRNGRNVAPSVFIPVAERSGLIHTLGAWMLKSACETAYPWCSRDAQRTTLSVNVSALQIDKHFVSVIGHALENSGFPAKQLELEITESALIANPDLTIEYLKQWKELGVRIAMDDFGTGYSSLSYLSRLPVDRLKLDQSLIHRMAQDAKTAAITRSIVSLGAELGIDVIAEGVETEQQLQMLTDLDCPRVQGYLLGRPMPATQAQLALRKAWGNRPTPISRPATAMAATHA
jgi:EAL domain-containing protein (putative c-di-GMP-specific phosphodiesterase class I)